jgi:hypothetical protein
MKRHLLTLAAVAALASPSAFAYTSDYTKVLAASKEVITAAQEWFGPLVCGTPSLVHTDPEDTTIAVERKFAITQYLRFITAAEVSDVPFMLFDWDHPRAIALAAWVDLGDNREGFFTVKCLMTPTPASPPILEHETTLLDGAGTARLLLCIRGHRPTIFTALDPGRFSRSQ